MPSFVQIAQLNDVIKINHDSKSLFGKTIIFVRKPNFF